MTQNESFEDLSEMELQGAEEEILGKWGPEIEAKLDQHLEYELTKVVGDLDASKDKQRVIIRYKPKTDFQELHKRFAKEVAEPRRHSAASRYRKGSSQEAETAELEEALEEEEFLFIESAFEDEARPLQNVLREEGGAVEEHLRLGNAVVTLLTPAQIKAMAGHPEVDKIESDKPMKLELDETAKLVGVVDARIQGLVGTGKGIIVAVIDGEVDINHQDLKGRVVHKKNYTNEPFGIRGDEDTSAMHGTHVAGIIGGNGSKYKGMAPEVTIWSYKIYPSQKDESDEGSKGADAIEDAVKDGAHVINCSWGVSGTPKDGSCIWCKTAERAAALGTVIVKSAGNSGSSPGSITCPAAAKGDVIVVGNAMRSGTGVMERSSRGPTADGRIKPDVLAPGEKITAPKDGSGGDYVKLTGTSMAAPHISGLAALMLEQNRLLKPWQIKKALMDSAKKLDALDGNAQGSGLVNIGKAMEAIKGTSGSASENQVSMTPTRRPRQVDIFSIGFRNTGKEVMQSVKVVLKSPKEAVAKIIKAEASLDRLSPGMEESRDFEIEVASGARSEVLELAVLMEFLVDGKQSSTQGKVNYQVGNLQ